MNQWFKLAVLAFVGVIVSSVTLGVVSGSEKQPDPAAGIHGTAGGSNANHNAGTGGTHGTDANGNYGTDGNVVPGYGPYYGQPGPNGYRGPWGPGYGPEMQQPNPNMNTQGNQGMQEPMGGGQDPMGGGMMDDDMMEMKMGMM